jgi:thiamine-phosphate pyrophosphorylase
VISCHNEKDIKNAIEQKADFITYSPIFPTPNKGEPKGLEELEKIVKRYPINIIALGGIISNEQIKELEKTGVYGFASIRYFV